MYSSLHYCSSITTTFISLTYHRYCMSSYTCKCLLVDSYSHAFNIHCIRDDTNKTSLHSLYSSRLSKTLRRPFEFVVRCESQLKTSFGSVTVPLIVSAILLSTGHCLFDSYLMNELPVIGYPCLRKELWDRQGANIASR